MGKPDIGRTRTDKVRIKVVIEGGACVEVSCNLPHDQWIVDVIDWDEIKAGGCPSCKEEAIERVRAGKYRCTACGRIFK